MAYAKISIFGNLGKDPETKLTPQGTQVTTFSVAVGYKESGETKTTWYRCTAWGKTAEIAAEYLKKGNRVILDGSQKLAEYSDREGLTRFSLEVNVKELYLVDRPAEASATAKAKPITSTATSAPLPVEAANKVPPPFEPTDDDIPF